MSDSSCEGHFSAETSKLKIPKSWIYRFWLCWHVAPSPQLSTGEMILEIDLKISEIDLKTGMTTCTMIGGIRHIDGMATACDGEEDGIPGGGVVNITDQSTITNPVATSATTTMVITPATVTTDSWWVTFTYITKYLTDNSFQWRFLRLQIYIDIESREMALLLLLEVLHDSRVTYRVPWNVTINPWCSDTITWLTSWPRFTV